MIVDDAYSARAIRANLRRRGIAATISQPAGQAGHHHGHGSPGGRPPAFDTAACRQRNVVERGLNSLEQWRGIATRFHNKARYSHATLTLASILIWLRTWPSTSHTPAPACRGQTRSRHETAYRACPPPATPGRWAE